MSADVVVQIGTAKLTRMAGTPADVGMRLHGHAPLLCVLVENAGEAPQMTMHFPTDASPTADHRWALLQRIVATREGVEVPA